MSDHRVGPAHRHRDRATASHLVGDREILQAKLEVGAADDPFEREADRVADRIVAALRSTAGLLAADGRSEPVERRVQRGVAPSGSGDGGAAARVQRISSVGAEGGVIDHDIERSLQQARSSGSVLPRVARIRMESAFDADFGSVRVHTGGRATDLSERIQAKAFTVGSDVFFRDGMPDTSTASGQRLLAHELTHTIQQGAGRRGTDIERSGTDASTPRMLRARSAGVVVQRALQLNGTNWNGVTSITASQGGASGVLFVSDGSDTLIVKPDISGTEEAISAHLHSQMAGGAKKGEWDLEGLGMRVASHVDILAIMGKIVALNPQLDHTSRLGKLANKLAAGTTMIQVMAPQGSKTFGRAMTDQEAAGGHLKDNKHMKVLKSSPLKPLFNDPSFAKTLGKAAVSDILTGNVDRIIGMSNLENWMFNAKSKQIFLIDNVGTTVPEKFETTGDGKAEFDHWAAMKPVLALAAGRVDDIARVTWSMIDPGGRFDPLDQERMDMTTHSPMADTVVTGARAGGPGQGQLSFVNKTEQGRLRDKFTRVPNKKRSHLERLRDNFRDGLVDGLIVVVKTPTLPMGLGSIKAQRMYAARAAVLAGAAPNKAWADALLKYP